MELTQGQEAAMAMVRRLAQSYTGEPRVGVIAGYAGTGKTSTIRFIAEEFGIPIVLAPTGKASLRVTEATGVTAQTMHRWLYTPRENHRTAEMTYVLKAADKVREEIGEAGFLLIDEASMVTEELWTDVYETCAEVGLNIICVGDAFQLPPVSKDGKAGFNILAEDFPSDERVMLSEVVRQALDSPIIRASMLIRNGDVMQAIMSLPRIATQDLIAASVAVGAAGGVVICHKNTTRHAINASVRERAGLPNDDLREGEPLMVTQNNYPMARFNGEVVKFGTWSESPNGMHKVFDKYRGKHAQSRFGVALIDDTVATLSLGEVFGEMAEVTPKAIEIRARELMGPKAPLLHCNLGYAFSCHKAQGSEWNQVVVALEGSVRLNTEEGRRWTYTALTRGKESVQVCLGVKL